MKKTLLVMFALLLCVQSAGAAYAQQAMLKQLTQTSEVSMPCHQSSDDQQTVNGQCCQDDCQCNHGSANLALSLNLPPVKAVQREYFVHCVLLPLSSITHFYRPPIFA